MMLINIYLVAEKLHYFKLGINYKLQNIKVKYKPEITTKVF